MSGKATAEAGERGEVVDEPSAPSRRAAAANGTTGGASEPARASSETAFGGPPVSDVTSATSVDGAAEPGVAASGDDSAPASFLRRHRLPLALAVLALCLYVGSIVYILYGRGQIA